ncbi:MAG: hypothetical protein ACE5KZ_12630 [Candidatus Scalinduaceae bacterium]
MSENCHSGLDPESHTLFLLVQSCLPAILLGRLIEPKRFGSSYKPEPAKGRKAIDDWRLRIAEFGVKSLDFYVDERRLMIAD